MMAENPLDQLNDDIQELFEIYGIEDIITTITEALNGECEIDYHENTFEITGSLEDEDD